MRQGPELRCEAEEKGEGESKSRSRSMTVSMNSRTVEQADALVKRRSLPLPLNRILGSVRGGDKSRSQRGKEQAGASERSKREPRKPFFLPLSLSGIVAIIHSRPCA